MYKNSDIIVALHKGVIIMEEQKVVVLQENQSAVDFVVNAISEMSGFTVVGSSSLIF